ncbi:serine dehydratase alpha chain [Lucifera butyrica]|uniref:UPF0597 protein LUCI_2305 n=1 Tax=Lucifera butyrica TaxID=1351585 RepID=A0A498R6S7_9FIRM|nr:L-serine ammonia-lyase, iron-sulfur-dependent, subunit alpha [Lucifera butyrica]VBB07061.1 serine dehydratase alpha chain [Lucifera butyrica]
MSRTDFIVPLALEEEKFLKLLDKELLVALGCTEPAAIAYAAALAKQYVRAGAVSKVEIFASGNVIKNAMAVRIPGTGQSGMDLAAALGVIAGEPEQKLEVLSKMAASHLKQAKDMVASGRVTVSAAVSTKKLYIEAVVRSSNHYARVVIEDQHTQVVLVEADGQVLSRNDCSEAAGGDCSFLNLATAWQFIRKVDLNQLGLVKESMAINRQMAWEGLQNDYGLQVGKTIRDSVNRGLLQDDLSTWAMTMTAAGSDARMAGCPLPVMSNSGSGNQGLCATLPVMAVGERVKADEGEIVRAVTLSHLVTIYIKLKFGRLSALCGAAIAGMGASCGIVYLLGGGLTHIKYAVQNMLGNVTGMLCDGAKAGCAMKVATCTSAAVQSAIMAVENRSIQATDGIIETDAESSLDNFCRLGNQGTLAADHIILDIILNKKPG